MTRAITLSDTDVKFWTAELAHRAASPEIVESALRSDGDLAFAPTDVARLKALDPFRDRPALDDDPDGAVFIDILLVPLADPPDEYRSVRSWPLGMQQDGLALLTILRALMDRDSIYETPECRVRFDGRARYNLAFDAASLVEDAQYANRVEEQTWTH